MKAVFFDIGETLIDETRVVVVAGRLARRCRHMTMFAVLGDLIFEGQGSSGALRDRCVPTSAGTALSSTSETIGVPLYLPEDLYPDVRPGSRKA